MTIATATANVNVNATATVTRVAETKGWVPEFEFEVWSLGIDCKKFYADCCWKLAEAAPNKGDAVQLKAMAQKQWGEVKALSTRINFMIDQLLGEFYNNGGQALQGTLEETAKNLVWEYLNDIEIYEQNALATITNQKYDSPVDYAQKMERYFHEMFQQMANYYPTGAVKNALLFLAK